MLAGVENGFGFIDSFELEQYENAWYQNCGVVGVEFDSPRDIGQCVCVAGGLEIRVCAER
jgi:hypothetical protein